MPTTRLASLSIFIYTLTMTADSGGEQFSELSIGIRELFRIVIPGAYVLILFEWLTAGRIDQSAGEGRTLARVAFSALAGLIAYGFQVHEKWLPYRDVFKKDVTRLTNAIVEAANCDRSRDLRKEYKYFLETRAPLVKERIHYFSSFYYMLDEMSLISAIAALILVCQFFHSLNPDRPISTYSVVAALGLQVIELYRDPSESLLKRLDSHLSEAVRPVLKYAISWLGVVAVWFLWNWALSSCLHRMWPRGPLFAIDWRFWALMWAAVIFERLGTKQ
jgi:hypothetical protein